MPFHKSPYINHFLPLYVPQYYRHLADKNDAVKT